MASLASHERIDGSIGLLQVVRLPNWPCTNRQTASRPLSQVFDGFIGLVQIGRWPLWPISRRSDGLICLAQNGMMASVASFETARRPHWPRAKWKQGLRERRGVYFETLKLSLNICFYFFKREWFTKKCENLCDINNQGGSV